VISWETIDFKGKSNVDGNISVLCPLCSHTRKTENKKSPCLYINPSKGIGKCKNCQEVAIKEPKKETKTYDALPVGWENHTTISDAMVKWFKNERGISQTTLMENKITEESYYQPAHGKAVNNIVFNYFEGAELRNKKYRSGAKKFTQCKNAKKIFYGINDVIGEKSCYIVEGEMDKLALWEIGVKNCISVPNGANDLNENFETCGDYIQDLEKIYIAVDNDEAGQKLENELIKRFGKWRCEKIEFKHGKDAGDELKHSPLSLQEAIEKPQNYPVDGSFNALDIKDEIVDLYENGDAETLKPTNESFNPLNEIFSIIPGQVTTITGVPSHGKSNFIEDYVVNLVADGLKASFFSPEHLPMAKHQSVLCTKVMGKPFAGDYHGANDFVPRLTKVELDEYIDWSKDKIHLIMPENGETATWDYLFKKFKEQMFQYGVDILVIDAWNKVKMNKPGDLGEINQILADLTSFAQGYGVSVLLIAHPRKMNKKENGLVEMPDLYDVKGSGDFRDQTHNGLCVYRYFGDENEPARVEVTNLKTKFQQQGEIFATASFSFDFPTQRYYPFGGKPNRDCLFKPSEPKPSAMVGNPDEWIEAEKLDDVDF